MADQNVPRTRRILRDIDSSAWEHPADRAALAALRRIPGFDEVLRKLFGLFGEKPIRLAFQANAVRVSERQFPKLHAQYMDVLETLDAPDRYGLFVSQTPLVNAGAYGMDKPFIVLNSGALALLDPDELTYLIGHEVGHVMSGHVLYRTMTVLLLQLATLGFPIVGLAARAILVALLALAAACSGAYAALLAELFPARIRYTALSFPQNFGNGWFGGLLPAVTFAIVAATGDLFAGLWYPVGLAVTCFVVGWFTIPETRDRSMG